MLTNQKNKRASRPSILLQKIGNNVKRLGRSGIDSERLHKLIQTLAIIVGGLWVTYLYFSFEREKNEVLLMMSKNDLTLKEYEVEQLKNKALVEQATARQLELANKINENEIEGFHLKQQLDGAELLIKQMEWKSIILRDSLQLKNIQLNEIEINGKSNRQIDWQVTVSIDDVRDLKYVTDSDGRPKITLTEYLVEIDIDIKNIGQLAYEVKDHAFKFYSGEFLLTDSAYGKIFFANIPDDKISNPRLKWKQLHEFTYGEENAKFVGPLNPGEKKKIQLKFYVNLDPENLIGVATIVNGNVDGKPSPAYSFKSRSIDGKWYGTQYGVLQSPGLASN